MLKGKRFQSLKDQKLVTVLEENGVWVQLDDSTNIKTDVFLQKYSEYFEAENFFTNDPVMERLAQQFTEKININTTPIVGPSGVEMSGANNPAGLYIEETPEDIERKKRDLLSNFQQNYTPPPIQNVIDENMIGNPNYNRQPLQKRERPVYVPPPQSDTEVKNLTTGETVIKSNVQQASYTEESESQPVDDIYKIYQNQQNIQPVQTPPQLQTPQTQQITQQVSGISGLEEKYQNQPAQPAVQNPPVPAVQQSPEQEAFMFFKKFKKIYPIDIKLTFKEMIADIEYVRQTSKNFDGDIIKFYTRELMNKLWDNPYLLEQQIYDGFYNVIMGEKKVEDKKIGEKKTEELPKKDSKKLKKENTIKINGEYE